MLRRFRQDSWTLLREIDGVMSNVKAVTQRLACSRHSDSAAQSQVRYAERLTEKILSSFDRIKLPDILSFGDVQDAYKELLRALESSTHAGRITVPHLNSGFKSKIIELDSEFKRLQGLLFKLAQVLRSSQPVAQQIEAVRRNAERAAESQERARQVRAETHRVEEQIAQLNLQLAEIDLQLERVRGEDWFKELQEVQTEIREIEGRFSKLWSQFNKPLKKLHKLVDEGKVSLRRESLIALRTFVEDTTYAFLKNTDLTHVLLLLHDVQRLLEDGKIMLEKRKKTKALEAIRVARDGFLKQIREEFEHLRQRERQLISGSEASGFTQDVLKLEVSRRRVEAEISELEQSKMRLQMKMSELQAGLKGLSRNIEESIRALLGVDVSILATP